MLCNLPSPIILSAPQIVTTPHSATDIVERTRAEDAGAFLSDDPKFGQRVNGIHVSWWLVCVVDVESHSGLQVTRSLGDLESPGTTNLPDVQCLKLR